MRFMLAVVVVLGLSSCGEDGSKESPKEVKKQEFSKNYSFRENGCWTGNVVFKATSERKLQDQLCEALTNHELNGQCAYNARKNLFQRECIGYQWIEAEPVLRTANPSADLKDPQVDWDLWMTSTTKVLSQIAIKSFEVFSDESMVIQFAESARDCGMSYYGTLCQHRSQSEVETGMAQVEDGVYEFYSSYFDVDLSRPVIVVAAVSGDAHKPVIDQIELFEHAVVEEPNVGLTDFMVTHRQKLTRLIRFDVYASYLDTLLEQIKNPTSYRQLYFAAINLYNMDSADYGQLIIDQLIGSRDLLADEENSGDLYGLAQALDASDSQLIELATGILASENTELKQYAAVEIFYRDATRSDLRPIVRDAFEHPNWDTRQYAMKGIAKSQPNLIEQIALLMMLNGTEEDIKTSSEIAREMTPTPLHVETLGLLLIAPNWLARQTAAVMLGQVPGEKSIRLLQSRQETEDDDRVKSTIENSLAKLTGAEAALSDVGLVGGETQESID